MATHIVRNPPRQWGNVVASSVGNVLSQLAEAKVERMRENEDVRLLSNLGIDPTHARFINRLPADQKAQAVGNYLNASQQRQMQEQQQSQQPVQSQMQQAFMPAQPEPLPTRNPVQQSGLAQLFGEPNSVISPQVLESVLRSPQRQQQQRQIAAQEQQQIQQQAAQRQLEQAPAAGASAVEQPAIARRAPKSVLGQALTPKETAAEQAATRREELATRKEQLEREKLDRREEAESNKQTQKYYEEVINAEKSAREADTDLKKMKRLVEKGKLPPSALYKILKDFEEHPAESAKIGGALGAGIGAIIGAPTAPFTAGLGPIGTALAGGAVGSAAGAGVGAALSPISTMALYGIRQIYPDTEEFEKLSNGFIRYAKSIFSNRITDLDLKTFLATVPTLANTEHGKKAIIHNMDLFNQAVHEKYKVMREIIKENGGKRPLDLALVVQDRLQPRLDKIARQWEETKESEEASALLRSV